MNTPQTKIADFNLVNIVLNSDVSGGEIESRTGITRTSISKYRKQHSEIYNITFQAALLLTQYAQNQISRQSGELINYMRQGKKFDYVIRTDKNSNSYLTNNGTNNLQSIFSIDDPEFGHIYGVYGDVIGLEQIDNRNSTDKEIQEAIEKLLYWGTAIPRNEATK